MSVDAGPSLSASEGDAVLFLGVVIGASEDPLLVWEKEAGVRVDVGPAYDSVYAFHPHVVAFPGGFRMYYAGNDGSAWRILSTTSEDQLTWTRETGIRVDIGGSYDSRYAYSSEIVSLAGGLLRMYYAGFDGSRVRILSAVSSDGLVWTKESGSRVDSGGSYDSVGALSPHVLPVPSGGFRMYYCGFDGSTYRILSATSLDGLAWSKETGIRIDRGGPFDSSFVDSPETVPLSDGRIRMFYHGNDGVRSRILSAVSDDGLTWMKESGIRIDVGGPYDPSTLGYPELAITPAGGFRLFYSGSDGSNLRILSAVPPAEAVEVWWDFDVTQDSDGDGIAGNDREASDAVASHAYGDDGRFVAQLCASDRNVTLCDTTTVTVGNLAPTGEMTVTSVAISDPRTQGYWNFQCRREEPPSSDHDGIQPSFIEFIGGRSSVFAGIETKEEVCGVLDGHTEGDAARARVQLMALWLNVASGKLSLSTPVDLSISAAQTVGTAIGEVEDILLTTTRKSDIVRAKDIADSINNGVGVAVAIASCTATGTDPGSDDLSVLWDFGDGGSMRRDYFNDGAAPDPDPSPGGTYPFTATDEVTHTYFERGSFDLRVTILDDDGGRLGIVVRIVV